MAGKEKVELELVRGQGPLDPAPASEVSEADLDAMLQSLAAGQSAAEEVPPLDLGIPEASPAATPAAAPLATQPLPTPPPNPAPAPVPVRAAAPEIDPDAVPMAMPVRKSRSEYEGAGSIVEVESDAQREAREEKAARVEAVRMVEERARAEVKAKADAEMAAIKAARAEMDAKKQKREEARQARMQTESDEDADDAEQESSSKGRPAKNVQERIRGLSAAEKQKVARTGDQRERVVLERMYGKNVWEGLLRNPKLTPPEVGRIARMGSLPVPLLELIVNNRAWLSAPQVRRALLSNPRLKKDMVSTILRATPKAELKLMPTQMAYPQAVRQAAKRLIRT